MFDRYEKRPLQHPEYNFNTMSLLEFATLFEPHYQKKETDIEEEDFGDVLPKSSSEKKQKLITLTDGSKLSIRKIPAVVRVPFFVSSMDPNNFYYSMLLQYMPYRSESELMTGFDSSRAAFLAAEEQLKVNSAYMNRYREQDKQLEMALNQAHPFKILEDPIDINEEPEEEEENEIVQEMDDENFNSCRQAMNLDQKALFHKITEAIKNQMDGSTNTRLRLFITGGAGTGKTFTFKILKEQVNRCYMKSGSAVKVGALTGVATRLVGGSTLHSLLKLPVQKDGKLTTMPLLTGNYLQIMRRQWADVEFIFIDEVSMVPYEMLCMIDSRLKQVKGNNDLFGGLNVLLFGDLMQLPPVRGHQIFQQPASMSGATHLWRLFNLIELKENMRQRGDDVFINILNSLRIGEVSADQYHILMQHVVEKDLEDGPFALEQAIRIYPTNKQVDAHNAAVLQHFKTQNIRVFKITAQDCLVDTTRSTKDVDLETLIPIDVNKTGGFPSTLEIFTGAKVMLRKNIDTSKGLVNGAIGTIIEIIWPLYRRGQIYDQDIPTVRVDFGDGNTHLILPHTVEFPAKYSYGTVQRRMLPLILSWATTVHKMQGTTVQSAVVYLGSLIFARGQAYVSLSRVKSLDGLRIKELNYDKLRLCNIDALNEIERMRVLE